MLKLTQNPAKVLKINDHYRRDSGNFVLYGIDDLSNAIASNNYKFKAPTVVPKGWALPTLKTEKEFMNRFYENFPFMAKILESNPKMVVAGSAASFLLAADPERARPGDIDLFPVGVDDHELWVMVEKCITTITECKNTTNMYFIPGLVTICHAQIKIQIILRQFSSVGALLHGFDIPSCCVAISSTGVQMTYAAMWAHTFQANIVCPQYRSTTYERRLRKYFDRGYAIVLPELKAKFEVGVELVLPHLKITPMGIDDNKIIGSIECDMSGPQSDYAPSVSAYDYDVHSSQMRNYGQIARGLNMFTIFLDVDNMDVDEIITYMQTLRCVGNIMTSRDYNRLLLRDANTLIESGKIGHRLIKVFGLDYKAILKIASSESEAYRTEVLQPFIDARIQMYKTRKDEPIEWWIKVDPSRQYTVSLNPIIENSADWYGAYYNASAPVKASPCIICKDLIISSRSTIRLSCGCRAHWDASTNCSGALAGIIHVHSSQVHSTMDI